MQLQVSRSLKEKRKTRFSDMIDALICQLHLLTVIDRAERDTPTQVDAASLEFNPAIDLRRIVWRDVWPENI